MDFLQLLTETPPERALALLPSPFATVLRDGERVRLLGPHDGVVVLRDVRAGALMTCAPNFVKVLAGHPRRFVGGSATVREVPLLRSFEESDPAAWPALLADLRASVDVTADERQFETVWRAITRRGETTAGTVDQRQAERLCRRYAGQSPSRALRQLRLAAQLAADIGAGAHRPLGGFADQSHYIRSSRGLTGRTPRHWRTLDASFRASDGALVPSARPDPPRSADPR